MSRRSVVGEDEATEINLSPMIDCIFILLIFFIVTTVFVEETGLQVHKPDAAAAQPLDEDREGVVLEITADNKILWEDVEIQMVDVPGRVKASTADPETPVVIRAHEQSDHGTFVGVWDAARRGGAQILSFNTIN